MIQQHYEQLNEISLQIEGLLGHRNKSFEAIKATIIGAFYSFYLALTQNYTDDLNKGISDDYLENIVKNYKDLKDKKWEAGYYFNSALYRLSAAYHRALKVYTKKLRTNHNIPKLLERAKQLGLTEDEVLNLEIIRKSVNLLKHEVFGLTKGKRPTIDQVIKAFKELLDFFEKI